MKNLNKKPCKSPNLEPYNSTNGWDKRYSKKSGLGDPGTYTHSNKGNKYFYRSKFKALDRCFKQIGTNLFGKTILDVAGGSGQFCDYFLKHGVSKVVMADFSRKALDIVNQRYGKDQRVAVQFFDLTCKKHRWMDNYDFIFIMEAIFLLTTDDDLAQAIKNIAPALKMGGYLIISDIFPVQTIIENEYVIRRSKAIFESLLAQNGFSIVKYEPQTFVFNRLLFGHFQHIVEQAGLFLYLFDQIAMKLGWKPPSESPSDVKYLISKRLS